MKPNFEVVLTSTGATSIRNNANGEIMHNPIGPWIEANTLYVNQSNLARCLGEHRVILFDVGLGAAANALAAVDCAQKLGPLSKGLLVISFEKDLELLNFAVSHSNQFSHFQGYERTLSELLDQKYWSTGSIHWELRVGEFQDLIDSEIQRPHIIFFDPYSPEVNPEMWSLETFESLRRICRRDEDGGTTLYTYSRSTPVRAAMLAAGFYVGHGVAVGHKNETTQAASKLHDLSSPLGERWISRWKNSHLPYPWNCPPEKKESVRQLILSHKQFSS